MYRLVKCGVLLGVVTLVGCYKPPEVRTVEMINIQAEILHVNRPKHFVLDVKDVATGNQYQYRSKHCNVHRKYNVGDVVPMVLRVYDVTHENSTTRKIGLANVC